MEQRSDKIKQLREALAIAPDAAYKSRLEQQIQHEEIQLNQLNQKLSEFEQMSTSEEDSPSEENSPSTPPPDLAAEEKLSSPPQTASIPERVVIFRLPIILLIVGLSVLIGMFIDELREYIAQLEPNSPCNSSAADVSDIDFSPNGNYLAAASSNNTVRVLKVTETLTDQAYCEEHADGVVAVRFSPEGTYLATASLDGFAGLGKISSNGVISDFLRLDHSFYIPRERNNRFDIYRPPVVAVEFSPDGKYLATGSANGSVRLWGTDNDEIVARLEQNTYVTAVSFSADGQYVAISSLNNIPRIWTWEVDREGKEPMSLASEENITDVSFSPTDSKRLVTASANGTVQVRDITNPEEPVVFPPRYTSASVTNISFSPTGRYVVALSLDNKIHMWDLENSGAEAMFRLQSEENVVAFAFSPDGRYLATARVCFKTTTTS